MSRDLSRSDDRISSLNNESLVVLYEVCRSRESNEAENGAEG